jgi:hypothetical protein
MPLTTAGMTNEREMDIATHGKDDIRRTVGAFFRVPVASRSVVQSPTVVDYWLLLFTPAAFFRSDSSL